jgi:hypothetical protein
MRMSDIVNFEMHVRNCSNLLHITCELWLLNAGAGEWGHDVWFSCCSKVITIFPFTNDQVNKLPLNNESRREVSACSCCAGGGAEVVASGSEATVAALVAAEEAMAAVELTARQRRIMEGSSGRSDSDEEDDEEGAFDDAPALTAAPAPPADFGRLREAPEETGEVREAAAARGAAAVVIALEVVAIVGLPAIAAGQQRYAARQRFKRVRGHLEWTSCS